MDLRLKSLLKVKLENYKKYNGLKKSDCYS